MSLKDMPLMERPREKASLNGLDSLTNLELLAILISTGTKNSSVLQIAYELITSFGGINGIINASAKELTSVRGINSAKALRILAGIHLYERALLEKAINNLNIKGKDAIGKFFVSKIGKEKQEIGYIAVVDSKEKLLFIKELFKGTKEKLYGDYQLILKNVTGEGTKFYFIHNHPSGNVSPSSNDIVFTSSLDVASMAVGIELVDHLIVNEYEYLSIREYLKNTYK